MKRSKFALLFVSAGIAAGLVPALTSAAPAPSKPKTSTPLDIAMVFWEYNASAKDLGVHINLDGENWKKIDISDPSHKVIFSVKGGGAYKTFGMSELMFEGAEPDLSDVPVDDLLALFPEGDYQFTGKDIDNLPITGTSHLSHAIPDGPQVSSTVSAGSVKISWTAVTAPPPGFPNEPINVVSYQVLVPETLDVIVPSNVFSLTLPSEYVAALASGDHPFEVLAIDANGNQTTTEGTFTTP